LSAPSRVLVAVFRFTPGYAGEGFSARLKRLERSRKKKANVAPNVRHLRPRPAAAYRPKALAIK